MNTSYSSQTNEVIASVLNLGPVDLLINNNNDDDDDDNNNINNNNNDYWLNHNIYPCGDIVKPIGYEQFIDFAEYYYLVLPIKQSPSI